MKTAAEEREFRRWVDGVAAEVRAKRIACLRGRVGEIDTALAREGLPADRRAAFDAGYEASAAGVQRSPWRTPGTMRVFCPCGCGQILGT
jgi:hypothetical protein